MEENIVYARGEPAEGKKKKVYIVALRREITVL